MTESFLESRLKANGVVMLLGGRVVGPEDVDKLVLGEGLSREEAVRKVLESNYVWLRHQAEEEAK